MTATALAPIQLRAATEADEPFLLALYGSTRDDLAVVPVADEREVLVRMQFQVQDLHFRGQHPSASFDVVEVDGHPAGRLYVDRTGGPIRIIDISLMPAHRDAGLGTVLLRGLQEEARATGATVSLHVSYDNRAAVLYERLGFRLVEDHGAYRRLEWTASAC